MANVENTYFNNETDWKLLGNTGTIDGTNFIGTTDDIPFAIKVNNQKSGRIDQIMFNVSLGYQAMNSTPIIPNALLSTANVGIGHQVLFNNTDGFSNVAIGYRTMFFNTTGSNNTAVGTIALNNVSTGTENTAIGSTALTSVSTGNRNTAVGYNDSVLLYNGSLGSFFGYKACAINSGVTNGTAIGAYAFVESSNSMVLGSIAGTNGAANNTNVGIRVTAPTEALQVNGNILVKNNQNKLLVTNTANNGGLIISTDILGDPYIYMNKDAAIDSVELRIDNLTDARIYQFPDAGQDATLVTSVNNVFADTLGNITLSAGDLPANIDAINIADGSVTNTEFQYINSLTSNAQTQLTALNTNKVTKGGDSGATLTIGTTTPNDLVFITNNSTRWTIDSTTGYLRRGGATADFGLHLFGTGAGSTIALGDRFDATTPYVCVREYGGTDTDQIEAYGQKGAGLRAGVFGSTTPQVWVTQGGQVCINTLTPVTGAELTVSGDTDISSTLNVQGISTFQVSSVFNSFTKYKTAATPSSPANGTEFNLYYKANKLIIQYNDGGTLRYKYLDLTGTGVTWVHSLAAP